MLGREIAEAVCSKLEEKFGLTFEPKFHDRSGYRGWGVRYAVQAEDGLGFDILLSASHHHAEAIFRPSPFAGTLVRALAGEWQSDIEEWRGEVGTLPLAVTLTVSVNGEIRDATDPFPADPVRDLEIETTTRIVDRSDSGLAAAVATVAEACLALVLTGLSVDLATSGDELPEGAATRIGANRYERNPLARRRCIEAHGVVCWVCDFEFGAVYGSSGSGFIEVHHRVPVSSMGGEYRIDPVRDLVPLCSNCHSMAHRERPPTTPERLREMRGLPVKAPLPELPVPTPVDVSFEIVNFETANILIIEVSSEMRNWRVAVEVDEFWRALEMADDGLSSELEVGQTRLPVKVRGSQVDILVGPVLLFGEVDEWARRVKARLASPNERSEFPTTHLPEFSGSPRRVGVTIEFSQ